MSNMIFAEIYTPSSSIPHAISVVLLDENLRIKTAPYTAMDPMQRYMYEYVRHMPLHLLQPCTAGSVFMRRTRLLLGHAVCLFCILLLFFYLFCITLVIPYNTYRFTLFYLFSQYSALFLLGFPFATLHYLRSCLHSFLYFLHYLLSRL